jgi:hypothetical protein
MRFDDLVIGMSVRHKGYKPVPNRFDVVFPDQMNSHVPLFGQDFFNYGICPFLVINPRVVLKITGLFQGGLYEGPGVYTDQTHGWQLHPDELEPVDPIAKLEENAFFS